MSEGNGSSGILKIGERGRLKCQFGDRPLFEVDVIALHSSFNALQASFRDAEGKIAAERAQELNQEIWRFVLAASAGTIDEKDLSLSMALEFLKGISEEAQRLSDFFLPRSSAKPSSAERTTAIFSE